MKEQHHRIYGLGLYYLRNVDDAQEVTQDTFIRIYRGLRRFRGDGDEFIAWMLSVARNCSIDRLRRQRTQSRRDNDEIPAVMANADPLLDPAATVAEQQRKRLVYRALDQFEGENRELLLLKEIQGLKYKDVARILALPIGTIKSRVSRARIELARIIVKLDPTYSDESPR